MSEEMRKANPFALLPLAIFVLLFVGSAAITQDFKSMPIIVAALIASIVAITMIRGVSFAEKVTIFTKGGGSPNIILLALIFILAGAFASVAEATGAVDSIVNLGISSLPPNLLMVGLFLISCFISISMGTSTGTVVAVAPIAIGIAEQTGSPIPLALAAVIGGSMFGDNLSMISDTTIAAVRTQQTTMKDKFRTNFFIVLPAAIAAAVIFALIPTGEAVVSGDYHFDIITIFPYIAVLIIALLGVNVVIVLIGGILFSGAIGLLNGSFTFLEFLQVAEEGIGSMQHIAILAILLSGMVETVKHNGGIAFILEFINKRVQTKRGAAFGIAGLVSTVDASTGNNTVAILMSGPLARNIAVEYGIESRKSASILDIFACCVQGLVPYSGQMLAATGLAAVSPLAILPYSFYQILIGVSGIIAILLFFRKQ
ncbi:Na+/H+ antiporter NhaC family protein [Alteribacillus iranensis]|uniref:Na+/H+ antiporter NhaC n=1 Tax=Alteribacillus iranensis TaxID=930128 RepID=A0A1I2B3Y6_9BACI|nr:Na+/H+ antiporter NhaC family protein [Alteribacillus iranensis]SFE50697.1 Na+/H+ antiporter NhaC [Alteribacillus iranensis]